MQSIEGKIAIVTGASRGVVRIGGVGSVVGGYIMAAVTAMRAEMERGEIVRAPVPDLEWRRALRIYRRKKGLRTPSVAILIDCLRQTAEDWSFEVR